MLLRTESASSSEIEGVTAGVRALALAAIDERTGPNAQLMTANVTAMQRAVVHRVDLPVLAQVAIAHAQFESIHPFNDSNGRVGRPLVHAMLRQSEVTQRLTVPVSAGLLTSSRVGGSAPAAAPAQSACGERVAHVESTVGVALSAA